MKEFASSFTECWQNPGFYCFFAENVSSLFYESFPYPLPHPSQFRENTDAVLVQTLRNVNMFVRIPLKRGCWLRMLCVNSTLRTRECYLINLNNKIAFTLKSYPQCTGHSVGICKIQDEHPCHLPRLCFGLLIWAEYLRRMRIWQRLLGFCEGHGWYPNNMLANDGKAFIVSAYLANIVSEISGLHPRYFLH